MLIQSNLSTKKDELFTFCLVLFAENVGNKMYFCVQSVTERGRFKINLL